MPINTLLDAAFKSIRRFLAERDKKSIQPTPEALAELDQLDCVLPEQPVDALEVFEKLDRFGSPATLGTISGRFFGFVIGGSLPVTTAANMLASAWDQNAALQVCSPVNAKLEEVAGRWLVELLGLPTGTETGFATGCTMANFTGLAAGRHRVLANKGWDVEADGLFAAPELNVFVGAEAHPTLYSALSMLGLGKKRVHELQVDGQGRIRADRLPTDLRPDIVCIQAGNINTGAFDPAGEIIDWAKENNAWVHVDGAFGLWAAVIPELHDVIDPFRRADSWATDAHKMLNTPYDCGLVFTRDREAIINAMSQRASYLQEGEQREPGHFAPELSRRARGVEVWAALHTLGRQGVHDLVARCCAHARRFAKELQSAGYEILNEVVFNQVLVSFGDARVTERAVELIQQEGTCWVGTSVWQGNTVMRISVSNWQTSDEDVTRSIASMLNAAEKAKS